MCADRRTRTFTHVAKPEGQQVSSAPAPERTQNEGRFEEEPSTQTSTRASRLAAKPPPPQYLEVEEEVAKIEEGETSDGLRARRMFTILSSTDALQGRRGSMEDSHISIDDLSRYYPDTFLSFSQRGLTNAFYGIYDGHVGKRASAFVSDILHERICRHPAFVVNPFVPLEDGGAAVSDEVIEEAKGAVLKALEEGFLQTDREFIEDAVKAENRWKDGTTAVVALFLHSEIFVANLGDSEALLGKRHYDKVTGWQETFEVLTEIHKPTVPAERARIEKEGGFIVGGRVGGLSISRAFGDRNMKLPIEEDGFWHGVLVDPHPYITHRSLTPRDCFLLLGCDGVWENWSHQECVDFIFEKMDEGVSVDELTEAITRRALEKGSLDNISATLILFKWE